MSHVDEGALHAYLDGALDEYPAADAAQIREHLDQCGACAERLGAERQVRLDAQAMLSLAVPNVDMPSLEELRAYVQRTRPERPASVRIYRMGWAASVVLAVGAGWMLRGGGLQDAGLLNSDFRRPAAEVAAPERANTLEDRMEQTPARQDALGASEPLDEAVARGARSRESAVGVSSPGDEGSGAASEQERSRAAGRDVSANEIADTPFGQREDRPGEVVAKVTGFEEALALESIVVTGQVAEAPMSDAQGVIGGAEGVIGATLDEVDSTAGAIADQDEAPTDALDALPETVVAELPPPPALDDAAALELPARDRVVTEPAPDADAEPAERRRGESLTPVASALNQAGFANERPATEEEPDVAEEPSLMLEDYAFVSMVNLGEGTTPLGVHVVQRAEDDRIIEIFHLEVGVEPTVLPALEEGESEASVVTEFGWIVMRGPFTPAELEELIARLLPEPAPLMEL